ncbi:hypothetical protein ALP30_05106 [Pseudomonas syringae pv. primulae]|nr:hypothetical protein ALP30_05106 [Pseudomonas syringae pv. primulae]
MPATAHDHDPVRQAQHFVEVGTDHDHRHAGGCQLGDHLVDRRPRTDVDASGRLVENEHFGVAGQPFGDDDFLLVATGQAVDALLGRAFDAEARNGVTSEFVQAFWQHPVAAVQQVGVAVNQVVFNPVLDHHALLFTVFGHQHHTRLNRLRRRAQVYGFAIQLHVALNIPGRAGNYPDQFGTACADHAGDAEHFTGAYAEVDAVQGELAAGEVFDLQHHPLLRRLQGGEDTFKAAPDHLLDQFTHRHLSCGVQRDLSAVAQDQNTVGDPRDFLQTMADVNERHAFGLEAFDLLKQQLGFFTAKGRRGFVENQQACVQGQGFGDLDQLLRGDAQTLDLARSRHIQAEAFQLFLRLRLHVVPVNLAVAHWQPPDKDVLGNRQLRQQANLLMDQADTGTQRRTRRGGRVIFAEPAHGASRLRLHQARDNRREGRFACAVFAEQGEHFARPHIDVDLREHLHRAVGFADVAQAQHRRRCDVRVLERRVIQSSVHGELPGSRMLLQERCDVVFGSQHGFEQLFLGYGFASLEVQRRGDGHAAHFLRLLSHGRLQHAAGHRLEACHVAVETDHHHGL